MNRGQFFSLTSILLILLLVSVFLSQVRQVRTTGELRVDRAQMGVLQHHAANMRYLDIPAMLRTSTRFALTNYTATNPGMESLTYENLTDIMRDGVFEGSTVMSSDLTTNSQLDRVSIHFPGVAQDAVALNYSLRQTDQPDPWKLRFTYNASYRIRGDRATIRDTRVYNVTVRAISITHPRYGSRIHGDWVVNNTECIVNDIFSNATLCTGKNLQPP